MRDPHRLGNIDSGPVGDCVHVGEPVALVDLCKRCSKSVRCEQCGCEESVHDDGHFEEGVLSFR